MPRVRPIRTYHGLLPLAGAFYRPATGREPPSRTVRCKQSQRAPGRPERRRSMSTLQHTLQPAFRNRIALLVVIAGTLAALTVALIVAGGNSGSAGVQAQPSQATVQRQLQSVAGARYGVQRPAVTPQVSPQTQLQAVAGARYHQPVGINAPR